MIDYSVMFLSKKKKSYRYVFELHGFVDARKDDKREAGHAKVQTLRVHGVAQALGEVVVLDAELVRVELLRRREDQDQNEEQADTDGDQARYG